MKRELFCRESPGRTGYSRFKVFILIGGYRRFLKTFSSFMSVTYSKPASSRALTPLTLVATARSF